MSSIRWYAEEGVDAAGALDMGRGALELAGAAAPVVIYAASMRGDACVIGAHQRAEDALADASRAIRRETGGPSAVAGEGVLYLALALERASTLMECPRDRVLNRNVRPILSALRALGGEAHYFGRELVSLARRPAALIAWTRRPNGRVLLETFLGVDRPFVVPDAELGIPPSAPRMLGKIPIAAREVLRQPPSARALAAACAQAAATMASLGVEERSFAPHEAALDAPFSPALRWSAPREVPIGIVRAGLTLEQDIVQDAALAGDFYQDADAPARLRAALAHGRVTPERLRDALNATYGPHGAVIEGLRSLQPVLEAFLELTHASM